jgi:glycosyltransferase involved in cell wall biosynthesis
VRVLIDYRPALRQRTGVGEYAHQLAVALVPRLAPDGQLMLFSSSWKDRLPVSPVEGASAVDLRIPVRLLNLAWHRLGWPPIELLGARADVVHAMHPLLLPSRRAAQVVTVHDLYFLDAPGETVAEIRRDYPRLAGAHARRADAVIVNSEHTAGQVVSRLGVDRGRITVCYPGAPNWARREPPGSPGPILFVGTIEPRKNVLTLLDAYRRLVARRPGAPELLLAGRAGQNASAALSELGLAALAGSVRHLGYVRDTERQRLYRAASMLVLPSLDEGFGMTALEAMTVGVPVIASNRGALPEVVGEAGVLFEPLDSEELAEAMERLLDDRTLADRCAELGRARSLRFDWGGSADRLLEAYRQAIERRRARSS